MIYKIDTVFMPNHMKTKVELVLLKIIFDIPWHLISVLVAWLKIAVGFYKILGKKEEA